MNMQKRSFFTSAILMGVCGCSVYAQQRPNFLIIVTDDQTYESIHCLNNPAIHTPNLDRLVQQGTSFTQAFNQGSWSGAVSVASRSMLITGQYLDNAKKNDAYLDPWAQIKHEEAETEVPLWGEVFGNAGYETFMTGKWHNSEYALLKSFQRARAVGEGMYKSISEEDKTITHYGRPLENPKWKPSDPKFGGNWNPAVKDIIEVGNERKIGEKYTVNKHTSELYTDEAVSFLGNYEGDAPFFMYVAFNAPHDPRQSPKSYVDMYPQKDIQLPVNFLPEHPFDQGDNRIRDEKLAPFPRTEEAVRLHRQEYYAMITHMDNSVGRILEKLEQAGLDENTYVIFTSDHGLAVGMHGLMGKQNQYDHTIRIPLIFKGPNIKKGAIATGQVYMQSLFATTCELANIPIPNTVDFRSLIPQLKSTASEGEEYIYGSYRHLQRMIRTTQYKLIVYPQANRIQLFDLQADPYETKDLSSSLEHQEIKRMLFNKLQEKQKEFEDTIVLGALDNYNTGDR